MVTGIRLGSASLALWAVFAGGHLHGAVIVYSHVTQFAAAAGSPLSKEAFGIAGLPPAGIPLSSLDATVNSPPVIAGTIASGIIFRSLPGSFVFLAPEAFPLGSDFDLPSTLLLGQNVAQPLILEFSAGVTAVAADVFGYAPSGNPVVTPWEVEMTDGAVYTGLLDLAGAPFAFLGLVASGDSNIRLLTFQPPEHSYVGVDNVLFSQLQQPPGIEVPEPRSLILWSLLAGAMVIGIGRRCRRPTR